MSSLAGQSADIPISANPASTTSGYGMAAVRLPRQQVKLGRGKEDNEHAISEESE
jgi:hypothetical protein